VIFGVDDALRLSGRLWEAGVEMSPLGPRQLRAVTHLDVDREGIERALAAVAEALAA
jgi:threonine aldolase